MSHYNALLLCACALGLLVLSLNRKRVWCLLPLLPLFTSLCAADPAANNGQTAAAAAQHLHTESLVSCCFGLLVSLLAFCYALGVRSLPSFTVWLHQGKGRLCAQKHQHMVCMHAHSSRSHRPSHTHLYLPPSLPHTRNISCSGWLVPVFIKSDAYILRAAGLDALVGLCWLLCVTLGVCASIQVALVVWLWLCVHSRFC